ncbi:hypothetical protein GGX14DRAFT_401644 [Mycena pura]|uniref:Uncharacterized protein n=1 Tax=Mycena pura TaxID=153505 RepID=A0AAD6V0I6_9AGAR|nr:hypothetical protein GGX14DRAFT_401644 [Mycena pura]
MALLIPPIKVSRQAMDTVNITGPRGVLDGSTPRLHFFHRSVFQPSFKSVEFDIEDGEINIGHSRIYGMLDNYDGAEARETAVSQKCLNRPIVQKILCIRQIPRVRARVENTEPEAGEEPVVAQWEETVIAPRGADVETRQLTTAQGWWAWRIQLHHKKLAPSGGILVIENHTAHIGLQVSAATALAPSLATGSGHGNVQECGWRFSWDPASTRWDARARLAVTPVFWFFQRRPVVSNQWDGTISIPFTVDTINKVTAMWSDTVNTTSKVNRQFPGLPDPEGRQLFANSWVYKRRAVDALGRQGPACGNSRVLFFQTPRRGFEALGRDNFRDCLAVMSAAFL